MTEILCAILMVLFIVLMFFAILAFVIYIVGELLPCSVMRWQEMKDNVPHK